MRRRRSRRSEFGRDGSNLDPEVRNLSGRPCEGWDRDDDDDDGDGDGDDRHDDTDTDTDTDNDNDGDGECRSAERCSGADWGPRLGQQQQQQQQRFFCVAFLDSWQRSWVR